MSATAASSTSVVGARDWLPVHGLDEPDSRFAQLASAQRLERTVRALEENGIHAIVVDSKESARRALFEILPTGAEVLASSSRTLEEIGASEEIENSGRYQSIRPQFMELIRQGKVREQRKLGAVPDYVVGSVHAVTERGQVVVASASGSQLAPYVFGAGNVIWVAGTNKLVSDLDEAIERVERYTFPLENERAKQAYGQGSSVSKLLIVNKEYQPGRITMILVKEKLGF